MSLVFLRRKYRLLLLIGIAGSLFLCFQLFSFRVISISGKQQHDLQRRARILDDELELEFKQDELVMENLNNKKHDLKSHGKILNQNESKIGIDLNGLLSFNKGKAGNVVTFSIGYHFS